MSEELRERVRNLERWVWDSGAIISAITIVGLITAAFRNQYHAFTDNSLTGTPCAGVGQQFRYGSHGKTNRRNQWEQ